MVKRSAPLDEDTEDDASFNLNDSSPIPQFSLPTNRGKSIATIALSLVWVPFWALGIIFLAPGKFLLWKEYYFPAKGKVYATGRRKDNNTVALIFSIKFWFSLAVFIAVCVLPILYSKDLGTDLKQFIAAKLPNPSQTNTLPVTYSLPNCNDPNILTTVKTIIANSEKSSPDLVIVNQEMQTSFDPQLQVRTCSAGISSSTGNYSIQYKESWSNQTQGQWYIQVYHE